MGRRIAGCTRYVGYEDQMIAFCGDAVCCCVETRQLAANAEGERRERKSLTEVAVHAHVGPLPRLPSTPRELLAEEQHHVISNTQLFLLRAVVRYILFSRTPEYL